MRIKDLPREIIVKIFDYKKVIESLSSFKGNSPPSIFVSSIKNNIGILLPPLQENTKIFEYPEEWYKRRFNTANILSLRSQMVFVKLDKNYRNIEKIQEVAASKNYLSINVSLKKSPKFKFLTDNFFIPVANPAVGENIVIEENPKIERIVEKVIYDTDLNAKLAVNYLYRNELEKSRLERIFSAGLLGMKSERKIVPTRNSITATDSIISDFLREEIKYYPSIEEIRFYYNEYLGNRYYISLIPGFFGFELIEIVVKNKKVYHDYEFVFKRKEYAENTAGGYYAVRLACFEGLKKIGKSASIIVVREIDEFVPIGVWKVREAVRDAFNKNFFKFDSINDLIKYLNANLKTKELWFHYSKLIKILREQKKIINY